MTEFSFLGELSLYAAYGEKMSIHHYHALETVFTQMFVPRWRHLAPQIQNESFLELD